ncbi:MAG: DUF3108 domain-containing protein [Bryobacteraceae bacterium]|nr:DUF3108 domain-containing protein [Bryobacteraceae bacterium]
MNRFLPLLVLAAAPVFAQKTPGEILRYTINWPSGLSLGESQLRSTPNAEGGWSFEFTIDAAIPGFKIADRFTSTATSDLCTALLEKEYAHGRRSAREKTEIDQSRMSATRETLVSGGGKSEFATPACARDLLAFVHFVRRELAQGRVAPGQTLVFGAKYDVRLNYTGAQRVTANGEPVEADRMAASVKGPATDVNFEIFFSRDAARTPVLVRLPLELGVFTMELVR